MKNLKIKVFIICILVLLFSLVGYRFTHVQQPITDYSLLNVKERGELLVGTNVPYEPMEFVDENNNIVGFDIDVAKEIASHLGVSLNITNFEWNDLFTAVKTGKVDIAIASITITPERAKEMLFSIPYFNGGQVIVVRKNDTDIRIPEDLIDKKVGVQGGTTCEKVALEYTNSSMIITYNSSDLPIEALKNSEIDAVVIDYVAASNYVKKTPSLKIVGEPFTQEFYGIVTKKSNVALMNEIDNILRKMKRSGKLDEIKSKWLK